MATYLENILASQEEIIISEEASSISPQKDYLIHLSDSGRAATLEFSALAMYIKQKLETDFYRSTHGGDYPPENVAPIDWQEIYLELLEMAEVELIPGPAGPAGPQGATGPAGPKGDTGPGVVLGTVQFSILPTPESVYNVTKVFSVGEIVTITYGTGGNYPVVAVHILISTTMATGTAANAAIAVYNPDAVETGTRGRANVIAGTRWNFETVVNMSAAHTFAVKLSAGTFSQMDIRVIGFYI